MRPRDKSMADCTPEAGRRGQIAKNLRRFAAADLMIAVGLIGLAVFLVSRPIHGRDDLESHLIRPDGGLRENLLRFIWFAGVPLLAAEKRFSNRLRACLRVAPPCGRPLTPTLSHGEREHESPRPSRRRLSDGAAL